MPLVLSGNPALLGMSPLEEEVDANRPPVINTYSPDVEKWRRQVWDQMPAQLKQRPDAATLLDKALYVIEGESGGNDRAVGDSGAAWGLAQSHHIPTGADASTQINDMWRLVSNNPNQWTDWGEGTTYNGQVFGALGNKPYNGAPSGSVGGETVAQGILGNRPNINNTQKQAISTYTDQYNQTDNPLIKSVLSKALQNAGSPIDPETGGVRPELMGPTGYNVTQPQETSPYVDESARGTLRGQLEAQREGQSNYPSPAELGIAGLTVANPLATAAAGVGAGIDERLGTTGIIPKSVPLIGGTGLVEGIGGIVGGVAESKLTPTDIAPVRGGPTVVPPARPNLRIVPPGERPPGPGIVAQKPDPNEFIRKAHELGMTDEEIKSAFPGALEAASGIDTTPQVTGRIGQEQAAKAAAAKRIWNRTFDETQDVEAANQAAKRAAAQAREALPEQKPNVLYSEEAASQMQQASRNVRTPGNAITPEELAFGERPTAESTGMQEAGTTAPRSEVGALERRTYESFSDQQLKNAQARLSAKVKSPNLADVEDAQRRLNTVNDILEKRASGNRSAMGIVESGQPGASTESALAQEADRLDRLNRTANPSDEELAKVAYGARALGDPFSELRQALKGNVKSKLQQAIDDAQQNKDERIPSQPLPPEQLNMLDDVLGQMSMQDIATKGPGPTLDFPPNTTGYVKLDAQSVAERARLSAEYSKNFGGPQMTEAEFRQQWNSVKTARDGGRRWPENWTQDKINAYQKLEQGLTGQANPNAIGQDVSAGLFPGPLFEEGVQAGPGFNPVPEKGLTLGQQRLNRGLTEPAGFPGEGEVVTAAKNLKPDQQARLLNKDWEPSKSIAKTAASAMADLISLPRSLQTRFDFSYPFRQGLLFVRRQGEFWDAFGKGLQSFWKDEDWKRAVESEYMNAPFNPQTLKLTKWTGGNMAQREEVFYNQLIDKFVDRMPAKVQPVARRLFDASEEAATIFINKLRSDVTNNVARKWIREGLSPTDPEFIQDLNIFGNYVNRATGYGNLGDLEKSVGLLNTVFYGARRNISMVQAPGYLFNASARVRVEAWKDFLGLFGMGASTLALAQLAGIGDVNTFNPNSADWGKLKIGDTRLDIWGGYQQLARTVYKMADGEYKNGPNFQDFWKNALPFLGNKLSPQAGAAVSTLPEGVRRPIQPVDRPFKLTDALAPLAWQGLVQAVKEDGALAGAIAATGIVGVGSQTYESQTDVRNKEAQAQFKTDYENLTPVQRQQVDKSQAVTKYQQENPSQYKQNKAAVIGPIDKKEAGYEQDFKNNQLSKPLPEIWADLGNERRGAMEALSNQFKDMFEGFDKTRFDKAVKGYYDTQVQVIGTDGKPTTALDFDATEAARQDYMKTLKPDEQQWLDEALQVSRESKSPAHQKYLKYIDERKAAGYFDVKPDDPDRAKKLVELDRKNPLQDALNWYWKGGTTDTNRVPALNSPDAVSLALQMAPDRPVTYAGLGRPLNQTPQVLQAWNDYGPRIQNYYTKTVPAYQEQEAQNLFNTSYAKLDRAQRERVASSILTQVRRGSPELEAILQYLGDTADGNGDYVVSAEAKPYLERMIAKYGAQPVNPKNASGRPSKFLVRQ